MVVPPTLPKWLFYVILIGKPTSYGSYGATSWRTGQTQVVKQKDEDGDEDGWSARSAQD